MMDAGINYVIYMEHNSGPKIANSTCGKTIVAGTFDRGSTVLLFYCDLSFPTLNIRLYTIAIITLRSNIPITMLPI